MPLLAFLRPNVPETDGYVACVGRVPLVVWLQYVLFFSAAGYRIMWLLVTA